MTNLEWCKQRALAYLDAGDTMNAFVSMMSDLRKSDDTRDHPGIEIGRGFMVLPGWIHDPEQVRRWIVGFN